MYITRALIGRNLCLDQVIQTQKFKMLLLFYKTITLWFLCLDGLIQKLGNVARVKKSEQNRVFLNSRNRCLDQAIYNHDNPLCIYVNTVQYKLPKHQTCTRVSSKT